MLKNMRFSKTNGFTLAAPRDFAKQGFTLVELLVVIAIIGILSSLSVVSLNSARGRARDAQRYNDLRQLFTAMTLYYDTQVSTPQYPDMTALDTVGETGTGWWSKIAGPGKFFPNALKDPNPKITAMVYKNALQDPTNGGQQSYCVYTELEGASDVYLVVTDRGLKTMTKGAGDGQVTFADDSKVCKCGNFSCDTTPAE